MRKALELSIISVPCLVIVSANSFEVEPPADTSAMSTPQKSSLWASSRTVSSLPRKGYLRPALRSEPKSSNSSMGRRLSSRMFINSWPTAPLAPTMANFMAFSKVL